MDLQAALNDAVITAFDTLSGDVEATVKAARQYNEDDWISRQMGQVVAAGAGANLVPGAHAAALTADLAFLLHKMAAASWGIGAIRGCAVFGKPDFINVLSVWTGTAIEELEYRAVTQRFYQIVRGKLLLQEYWDGFDISTVRLENFLALCNETHQIIDENPDAYREFLALHNAEALSPSEQALMASGQPGALKAATNRASHRIANRIRTQAGTRMMPLLAANIAGKIGAKMVAKAASGFVPILGAVVGGGLNYWIIQGIARSAAEYYSHPIDLPQPHPGTDPPDLTAAE